MIIRLYLIIEFPFMTIKLNMYELYLEFKG